MSEFVEPINGGSITSIPHVAEGDIEEAERVLGVSFDESRRSILLSNESFDVQACPGSGKTTLLVAKLFILVKKWPHTRRGICVISHTNVARQEIERKLASTGIGQRMLNYPHFVGTIHSFVNEYLALPLLRSEGYHVQMIDDEVHGDRCARLLHTRQAFATAKNFLSLRERNTPDKTIRALRYEGPDLTLGSATGTLPCDPNTTSGRILSNIKHEVVTTGIWRFDDMFAWAERLLTKYPRIIDWVRWRFPVVLLDEAQDTSELQASLLNMVFPAEACELRQRFGDSNQAIYDTGQSEASTDKFPADGFRSITDSKRFGPEIACLAKPVAPMPLTQELCGSGPSQLSGVPEPSCIKHTIFLFSRETIDRVLSAFGGMLLETFPDEVFQCGGFLARAIGRVGVSQQGENKIPRDLRDYWNGYKARIAKFDPRPSELTAYVRLAQHLRMSTGECNEAFKLVMKGIGELIRLIKPEIIPRRVYTPHWVIEELRSDANSLQSLRQILWAWVGEAQPPLEEWWQEAVDNLKGALTPILNGEWNADADEFCCWSAEQPEVSVVMGNKGSAAPNVYRFEQDGCFVNIEVGTIHSAKGQTHSATLIVETFYKKHDLEDLLPWLSGQESGASSKEGKERLERMRLVYTAMTRPSHLLCLALRRSAVSEETRHDLTHYGWEVLDLETDVAHSER